MSGLGKLSIQLELDQIKFQQGMSKAQQSAKRFADSASQHLREVEKAVKNINQNSNIQFWHTMGGMVGGITADLRKHADAYTELNNKIKLVTATEAERIKAVQAVYDISLKTAQSTQATSSLYQTFAQNAKSLGIAQNDVAKLTETVSKAIAVSGASSATASNALIQFGQSLMMGKLKAQEFNSLITQTPTILEAIAKGLGISTGELKAMVDDGKMTADKMIEGLKKAEHFINSQYAQTTATLGGAFQNLTTQTEKWVGETDKALGLSDSFVRMLGSVGNNLNWILPSLGVAGAGFGALFLSNRINAGFEMAKSIVA